ncbi:MAG: PemK-like protein [Mycoplasmataceae bacterium RV_VA103A]|nr:MAG: PemK-like protein [Mycoplasmataceae bacterium RV_VA103A]
MSSKIPKQGEKRRLVKDEHSQIRNSERKSIPRQGEIWLVDFNRKKIKEQSKIRPVLILSNNWQNQYNDYSVVAPLTSEEEELQHIEVFEVLIEISKENGLDKKSKILLHRLLAIDKEERLIKKLGRVDSKIWGQVWKALWVVFTGHKLD